MQQAQRWPSEDVPRVEEDGPRQREDHRVDARVVEVELRERLANGRPCVPRDERDQVDVTVRQ